MPQWLRGMWRAGLQAGKQARLERAQGEASWLPYIRDLCLGLLVRTFVEVVPTLQREKIGVRNVLSVE